MNPEDFSKAVEQAYKTALEGADAIRTEVEKIRLQTLAELDAAKEARAEAEKTGEKMAQTYFENRQAQFQEAARTELLRRLVRKHLESGKTPQEIATWLDVPMDFIENIRQLLQRLAGHSPGKKTHPPPEGNPSLRYDQAGRGGTIYYENLDNQFSMWWEFAGGDALVIVGIPTEEQWESHTGIPLAQREPVLHFIGEQIVRDKISGSGSFVVSDNTLTFYA